jgi:hypothetical protein
MGEMEKLNFVGQHVVTIKSRALLPSHYFYYLSPISSHSCVSSHSSTLAPFLFFVPTTKLHAMDSSMEYLTDLEGSQVTFDAVAEPPFNFPAQKWIILEKLGEVSNRCTKEDIANGLGPSDTCGKFLCRPASEEDDNRRAFLRIYQQVPIAGTEVKSAAIRARQAVDTPPDLPELMAFRTSMKLDCDVVPRLLAYQQRRQADDEGVPGGYITYILWEKVAGESLNLTEFWRLPFAERKAIRDKFCQVYTYEYLPSNHSETLG